MADLSIEELRREHNERVAKRTSEAVALLNSSFPDMEIDLKRLSVAAYGDSIYRSNNLEYIKISLENGFANKHKTDLGYTLDWNEKHGKNYHLFETPGHIVHVERIVDSVYVSYYSKLTGKTSKGKRHFKDIKTSGKGEYIVLDGTRYYLDRPQRNHGEKSSVLAQLQENLKAISKEKQGREHAPKRESEPEK